jgi:hypothetical protein
MSSLRNEKTRNGLIQRLHALTPETRPQWGKLDAPRLLCHLGDSLAMALGDLPTQSVNRRAFQHFPMKHLILYVLPFPKNVPTVPELLSSAPGDFERDRQRVIDSIGRLASAPQGMGAEHPFFGPLTSAEWSALQCKHLSHHLQQFGL